MVLVLGLLVIPAAAARTVEPAPVSIFYYPWYGTPALDGGYTHWQQGYHLPPLDIASNFYPARGPYSSASRLVVGAQMREIRSARVGEVVSSWWGWGSPEDRRLPLVVDSARRAGLTVAVQIEPYDGRTAKAVGEDIAHLRELGVTRFYVYRPFEIDAADWAALNPTLAGVQMLAQTANVSRAAQAGFDGVYTYDLVLYGPLSFQRLCARARALRLVCAPSVGPGYVADRATGDPRVRPRRAGRTYDAYWRAAIAARAERVTITSYNEWHEGTQIEPARPPGDFRVLQSSPLVRIKYESYEGAYGLAGAPASRAYLARTAYWAQRYGASR
jgi:hypothetical protein